MDLFCSSLLSSYAISVFICHYKHLLRLNSQILDPLVLSYSEGLCSASPAFQSQEDEVLGVAFDLGLSSFAFQRLDLMFDYLTFVFAVPNTL